MRVSGKKITIVPRRGNYSKKNLNLLHGSLFFFVTPQRYRTKMIYLQPSKGEWGVVKAKENNKISKMYIKPVLGGKIEVT